MPAPRSPAEDAFAQLLHAAEMMLSARSDDMLTTEEWDALAVAVVAAGGVVAAQHREPDDGTD